MFAFSQIVANGANPNQVVTALEQEIKNRPKVENHGLDYDSAVAAYSDFISGDAALVDPAEVARKKAAIAKSKQANAELKELQSNDATSAFSALAEQVEIEQKAESFEGSAPEEKDEEVPPPKPKKTLIKKKIIPVKPKLVKKTVNHTRKKDVSFLGEE